MYSFICVGERRRVGRETESQEEVPGRSTLDSVFLERGLLSHPTPDSGSSPTSCTDPWASNCCQMCPCCQIFPAPPFFFQLLIQGYPYQVSPRFPHPASGLLWGIGDGIFLVSSQLGSPGNPENGRKKLGSFACTGFVCITSRNGQSHKVVPSLTPGWPPTLTVGY